MGVASRRWEGSPERFLKEHSPANTRGTSDRQNSERIDLGCRVDLP